MKRKLNWNSCYFPKTALFEFSARFDEKNSSKTKFIQTQNVYHSTVGFIEINKLHISKRSVSRTYSVPNPSRIWGCRPSHLPSLSTPVAGQRGRPKGVLYHDAQWKSKKRAFSLFADSDTELPAVLLWLILFIELLCCRNLLSLFQDTF